MGYRICEVKFYAFIKANLEERRGEKKVPQPLNCLRPSKSTETPTIDHIFKLLYAKATSYAYTLANERT